MVDPEKIIMALEVQQMYPQQVCMVIWYYKAYHMYYFTFLTIQRNGQGWYNWRIIFIASSLAAAALAVAASKEPPPLGLAGLEAFRREYLTSPLSHLRGNDGGVRGIPPSLLPPFPPLMPQLPGSGPMSLSESSFNRTNTNRSSLSGGGTPPGGDRGGHGSAHSTPSSEFSSQQNWSFEEQFKHVNLIIFSFKNIASSTRYIFINRWFKKSDQKI